MSLFKLCTHANRKTVHTGFGIFFHLLQKTLPKKCPCVC